MHRAVTLCHKFCDGKISPLSGAGGDKPWGGLQLPFDLDALRGRVAAAMETFALKVICVVRWGG